MKRTISVIIAAVVALSAAFTAFAGGTSAQNAQVLSAVNIEDTVCGNNRCSCTDLRTGETLYPFSYSIDEGEAVVLVFLNGNDCMNSTSLVDQLQEADWITEPGLTMIMIESVSAGMDYDDFTGYYGEIDQSIALYTSDMLMWYYYWLVSDDNSVTMPVIMVIERENDKNMIKHYFTGYT